LLRNRVRTWISFCTSNPIVVRLEAHRRMQVVWHGSRPHLYECRAVSELCTGREP
jgi:hypothetical protein